MSDVNDTAIERLQGVGCNQCGGTVDIPADARFVTCGFCGSRLRVERSQSALFTVEMDEMKARTRDLEQNVSALRHNQRVETLDRRWQSRLAELSVREGDDGGLRPPSLVNALLGLIGSLAPMALILSGAFGDVLTGFGPFLVLAVLGGVAKSAVELFKYQQFRRERAVYWAERARLTSG